MKGRRAEQDKRIIHTAAKMAQAKAASPKGEENGLSVQRESVHKERKRKERDRNTEKKK